MIAFAEDAHPRLAFGRTHPQDRSGGKLLLRVKRDRVREGKEAFDAVPVDSL